MNTRTVAKALLMGIVSRGRDATGAAWFEPENNMIKLTKIGVAAEKFIPAREEIIPENAPVMILHTRTGTHGSATNRNNNHPIHHRNIVGVHNGVLWNDKELFKELGHERNGEVDSEAIMALLSDDASPTEELSRIGGDAAVAWLDVNDASTLHIAKVCDRPVHIVQTAEGSLIFASTKSATDSALKAAGLTAEFEMEMDEATYMRVVDGVVCEYSQIPGVRKNASWSRQYAYTSGPAEKTGSTVKSNVVNLNTKKAAKKKNSSKKSDGFVASRVRVVENLEKNKPDSWWKLLSVENLVILAGKGSTRAVGELATLGRNEKGALIMPERVKICAK